MVHGYSGASCEDMFCAGGHNFIERFNAPGNQFLTVDLSAFGGCPAPNQLTLESCQCFTASEGKAVTSI